MFEIIYFTDIFYSHIADIAKRTVVRVPFKFSFMNYTGISPHLLIYIMIFPFYFRFSCCSLLKLIVENLSMCMNDYSFACYNYNKTVIKFTFNLTNLIKALLPQTYI